MADSSERVISSWKDVRKEIETLLKSEKSKEVKKTFKTSFSNWWTSNFN